MKKILVLGGTGMAGHMVSLYLEEKGYDVYNTCYRKKLNKKSILCDISDYKKVISIIEELNPNVIINCIGVLNKTSEEDVKNTVYVNTFFPKMLQYIANKNNLKLIHISTDCVFSGRKGAYKEKDFKDENGIYGLSKNLGEVFNNNTLTFRTSIIGPELKNGSGLFHWFMNQEKSVYGYRQAIWSGVTTLELAKGIEMAIKKDLSGLYHFVNNNNINKYELVSLFNKYYKNSEINILEDNSYICDKSLLNTRDDFDFIIKDYEEMIIDMKEWMNKYRKFYTQYEW